VAIAVPAWGGAAETPAQVTVTVEVKNRTANGATVVGDDVTLLLYKGQEQTGVLSAKAGQDGRAVFENVSAGQDIAAVARAKHQNMGFNGQVVSLAMAGEVSVDVPVFDVSTDTSRLSLGTHHIMGVARAASVEFTEYMQLNNPSDMAITSAQRDDLNRPVVIAMGLPRGFKDLKVSGYLEEEAMVVTADGFYDTLAVPPGEHQVSFSYKLDIDRETIDVSRKTSVSTSELMVFWEHGQGRVEGMGEPSGRLTNAQGVPIDYYRRANLQSGQEVSFQITGFSVKRSDAYTWIVLAAVFAVVVVIAIARPRAKPNKSGRSNG
jgi:hypothetical protein